jgi:hypothetical protein
MVRAWDILTISTISPCLQITGKSMDTRSATVEYKCLMLTHILRFSAFSSAAFTECHRFVVCHATFFFHEITRDQSFSLFQALYHLGCLEYSEELTEKLKEHVPLPSGCNEEVEIRGNSIWAVELLRRDIQKMIIEQKLDMKINAILLDFYIWDYAKEIQGQVDIPTHRTRSVYY